MPFALSRRQLVSGAVSLAASSALRPQRSVAAPDDSGISHSAESIHQEPFFRAARDKVYRALTDPQEFDRIVQLSEAMNSPEMQKMPLRPSVIGQHAGSVFVLFAGFITGRQLKLVPNELIIQAWRAQDWDADAYSIVRFKLVESNSGTKIVFDHMGFPAGEAGHLAAGWHGNYWNPMTKILT
jgi:activator of HSP90 ATPase